MEGTDVIFHSEVMQFSRISHFVQESGRVLRLGIRLGNCSGQVLHMRQQRVDNILLTVRLHSPPKIKKKENGQRCSLRQATL